ncbi:hypothetical protein MAR621_02748 [Maribacter dokdonensis]|nr:hypothetical protein MAR621_02748 [Maribacter dokdonensis]
MGFTNQVYSYYLKLILYYRVIIPYKIYSVNLDAHESVSF